MRNLGLLLQARQSLFRQVLKVVQGRMLDDVFQRGAVSHVLDDLDRVAEVP